MHRPCRLVIALLLFLFNLTSAFSLPKCPPIPHWTLLSVNVTYSNDTNTPGVVSLEVLSSTMSATDLFTCNLQFNSICLPNETRLPSDRDVLVRFYINIELARITFNKTWDCGGGGEGGAGSPETPRPQYAIGFAEFHMACPEVITEDMTCVGPSEGVMELDGVIVEAPPPSQEEDESSGYMEEMG